MENLNPRHVFSFPVYLKRVYPDKLQIIRAFGSGHIGGYRQTGEDPTDHRYRNVILTNALDAMGTRRRLGHENMHFFIIVQLSSFQVLPSDGRRSRFHVRRDRDPI